MLAILLLFMAIMFVLVPLVDRQQKRRKAEWRERRKRLMAIGSDFEDDTTNESDARAMRFPAAPFSCDSEHPSQPPQEEVNPYQPPAVDSGGRRPIVRGERTKTRIT